MLEADSLLAGMNRRLTESGLSAEQQTEVEGFVRHHAVRRDKKPAIVLSTKSIVGIAELRRNWPDDWKAMALAKFRQK
jgi:hypothetical protein